MQATLFLPEPDERKTEPAPVHANFYGGDTPDDPPWATVAWTSFGTVTIHFNRLCDAEAALDALMRVRDHFLAEGEPRA